NGDLLIAGTTDYDVPTAANLMALDAIRAEWVRTDLTGTSLQVYQQKVSHLMNGGGLNGTYRLNATTAHDDGVRDVLSGRSDYDWFLAITTGPNADTIKGLSTGEIVTQIS